MRGCIFPYEYYGNESRYAKKRISRRKCLKTDDKLGSRTINLDDIYGKYYVRLEDFPEICKKAINNSTSIHASPKSRKNTPLKNKSRPVRPVAQVA